MTALAIAAVPAGVTAFVLFVRYLRKEDEAIRKNNARVQEDWNVCFAEKRKRKAGQQERERKLLAKAIVDEMESRKGGFYR